MPGIAVAVYDGDDQRLFSQFFQRQPPRRVTRYVEFKNYAIKIAQQSKLMKLISDTLPLGFCNRV